MTSLRLMTTPYSETATSTSCLAPPAGRNASIIHFVFNYFSLKVIKYHLEKYVAVNAPRTCKDIGLS